ncbi:acyl-ACP--UDP-N-acetylglucosamine O-acyltransferase [Puniceicoccaceae bacterium K14]|nr:acyl-ACP--UDP-N-acetylglucosamine O-acyltransferase [Puniceicoccaceae bacterium K14]
MATKIHPLAVVDPKATIADDVEIGPFAVIGPEVTIGRGTKIWNHATVWGYTFIGEECEIFPYASIGMITQDLKFAGGRPGTKIGDRNRFREYVTVHSADKDGEFTVLGNDNYLLAYCHVGHDCIIGNNLIASNGATFGGHVTVEDNVIVGGGGTAFHQFCHIGKFSFTGGCAKVEQDIPPFMLGDGHPAKIRTFNKVGLERQGFDARQLSAVKFLFKAFYWEGKNRQQALEAVEASEFAEMAEAKHFCDFVRKSERGLAGGTR